jgi:hypothetical protein
MYSNLRATATLAASIPIASKPRRESDPARDLVSASAGALDWAATAVRWSQPLPLPTPPRRVVILRCCVTLWRGRSAAALVAALDARLFQILYDEDGKRKR